MCMFLARPKNKRVTHKIAYKVFVLHQFRAHATGTLSFPHTSYNGLITVPTNRWLTTTRPGFHVFLTKKGAENYGNEEVWAAKTVTIRVKIRGEVFGAGLHQGYEGIRVSGLYVPRKKGKS